MITGERFRRELEQDAQLMASGKLGKLVDEANAQRVRLWAGAGAEVIDDPDADKAIRYLLALTVNLLDQHSMTMQNLATLNARAIIKSLRVPLWISTVGLIVIAIRL